MAKKNKVFLVGAGPGDPGLITVRAIECLRQAEVVIYDYLANEAFLKYVPPDAEIIYVGKKGGSHTKTQDEINELLVKKAKEKVVVRLKGGDPFIFGRGGEEAEVLEEAGIQFEIVPGVTSAIAVPAYAGIPLTHRDFASSVAFITGHERADRSGSRIAWGKLSSAVDTLVFLMGVKNLPSIVDNLLKHGRSENTSVAVIQWGTTKSQRTAIGTLATITEEVEKQGITAPAIIVVGDVVKLRKKLNWFERKPLFGRTILVTRAREQASEFVQMLEEHGARCLVFPTIKVIPPSSWEELDTAIRNLDTYQWLIFTSVNGVRFFFNRLFELGRDVRDLKGIKLCAIGPKTAEKISNYGLALDFVPPEYRAEAIVEGLGKENISGKRILLPRAAVAREILPQKLKELGAIIDVVEAYRTVLPEEIDKDVKEAVNAGSVDCITFTSSSTVRNFAKFFSSDDLRKSGSDIFIACIGPITADTARELGFNVNIIPQEYTLDALTESIVKYFSRKTGDE
ncbi:MAG TPA: uroporphyrinogen-III C-methyltransferase [Deltaproteobacteria bacterium]|nr:uroporphyrinogen-III C-methyltransferase [Deltaproteobacteria bacterium]